ncbi:MAG: radical SAM protein [Candidatus Omnitrophota bacterium]|nr:radical SAM protein [Candidatus Omnitrophota bacterium]
MPILQNNDEIILVLDSQCDNSCVFCQNSRLVHGKNTQQLTHDEPDDINTIKCRIRLAKSLGFRKICFTGNEILNRSSIIDLLVFARKLSFTNITVQTTGRKLKNFVFLKKVVTAGANGFHVPIYGSTAKINDAITNSPGSFVDLMEALNNLSRFDLPVTLNGIFLTQNYADIPSLVRLKIEQFPGMRFMIDHYRPHAASLIFYHFLMPRYTKVIRYFKKAVELYTKRYRYHSDLFIYFARYFLSMPFCIINKIDKEMFRCVILKISRGYLVSVKNKDDSFKYTSRRKVVSCSGCVFNSLCLGPYVHYLKAYGSEEFRPIKGA